jgi:phosphomannomutase
MFMWTVRDKGCAYGLAVTASHNPALYNGLKIFTEGGRDAEIEVTDAIADAANRLSEPDIRSTPSRGGGCRTVTLQTSLNGTSTRSSPSSTPMGPLRRRRCAS